MLDGAISKAHAAVEQHLKGVAASAEAQSSALQQSLHQTDAQLQSIAGGSDWTPTSDDEWWWTLRRLQTLQHLDRLQTALDISQGAFKGDVFAALRDADISKVAEAFATAGNLEALTSLIRIHPYSLLPCSLDLLSSVPETVAAKSFGPPLKLLVSLQDPPDLLRPADWVESETTCIALRHKAAEHHHLLLSTEHMAKLNLGWAPVSEADVAAWTRNKAIAIDHTTGQLHLAIELIDVARAALHYGPESQSLMALRRAAQALSTLVQFSARKQADGWRTDLGHFSSLEDVMKLRMLFDYIDGDELPGDIRHCVIPFVGTLGSGEGGEDPCLTNVVSQALELEAQQRLSWVSKFIAVETERPEALGTYATVARTACTAAYSSSSTESWALQEALLGSAEEALSRASSERCNDPTDMVTYSRSAGSLLQLETLRHCVAQAKGHVTAARVLTRHGLPTTIAEVRDIDHDTGMTLIRMLLARVARERPSESRWADLWGDLQVAQEHGLQALPRAEIQQELCRVLLGCGQLKEAQKHLDVLEPDRQEALVLEAAREVFYSEGAPDAAAVKSAKQVLSVLPGNVAVLEEASFIDAAARLRTLGVDMPPLQLRQAPDKAALLRQALRNAPPKALRDVDGLVAVSEALGTSLERDEVLVMVADVALEASELKLAESVAIQLAAQQSRVGGHIASKLALEEPCSSESIRRSLLAYAMRFAPCDELEGQLHCWQASDAGASGNAQVWMVPEVEPDDVGQSYLHAAERPLVEFLSASKNNNDEYNGDDDEQRGNASDSDLILLSSLLALGPARQKQWAQQLQDHRTALAAGALRQGYVAGLLSTAITALVVSDSTSTTGDGDADEGPNISACDILSATPRDVLCVAMSDSSPASMLSEESKSLLEDFCRQLVAAADARNVSNFLPFGQQAAGAWVEGDAASQRAVVLQLAAAAARLTGSAKTPDAPATSEDLEDVDDDACDVHGLRSNDHGVASLSQVLSLAGRCNVLDWEVYRSYLVTLLRHQKFAGTIDEELKMRLNVAWIPLRSAHPTQALGSLLGDVFPAINHAEAVFHLLQLCSECCHPMGKEHSVTASKALSHAAATLSDMHKQTKGLLDCKTVVKPVLEILVMWLQLDDTDACDVPAWEVQRALEDAVLRMDSTNVESVDGVASGVDLLAEQHVALAHAVSASSEGTQFSFEVYPASGSTLYLAAACRTLHEIVGGKETETAVSELHVQLLRSYLSRMIAKDVVRVGAYATGAEAHPLHVPPRQAGVEHSALDLTSEQQLVVAKLALAELDARGESSQAKEDDSLEHGAHRLRRDAMRLEVYLKIKSACPDALCDEGDILRDADMVATTLFDAQECNRSAHAAESELSGLLEKMFGAGIEAMPAIFAVADALVPVVALSGSQIDSSEALTAAVTRAVAAALQTLTGDGGVTGLSIGDAVQALYGVLRSLDGASNKIEEGADELSLVSLDSLRTATWHQLQHHASSFDPGSNAAAAESHLQVLQMLGSLGTSMWHGWMPPESASTSMFKHAEALLHSKVTATLASVWPRALQQASISAEDFSSIQGIASSMVRVVSLADTIEQVQAVLAVLTDVFLGSALMKSEQLEDDEDPLHQCWIVCFTRLLSQGVIDPVISALDMVYHHYHVSDSPTSPSSAARKAFTRVEAESLVAAAEEAGGLVTCVTVALLTPYEDLRSAAWNRLEKEMSRTSPSSSGKLLNGRGVVPLVVVALFQGRFASLMKHHPSSLRPVLASLLSMDDRGMFHSVVNPVVSQGKGAWGMFPFRTALAASIAAQVVLLEGIENEHAAAWVAMEHSGLHPMLRVLDSAPVALRGLLRAAADAQKLSVAELEPESCAVVVAARSAEAMVRRVSVTAAQALDLCERELSAS